jgi:CTP:phosphocholine cytidylyltransferase-like protein
LKRTGEYRTYGKFNNMYKAENELKDNYVIARAKTTSFCMIHLHHEKTVRKAYVYDQGSH